MIVSVQQRHAHQGYGVHRIGLDIPWLPIPEHGHAIDVKQLLAAIGQLRTATTATGEPKGGDHGKRQGQKAVESRVNQCVDVLGVPCGPCTWRRMIASESALTVPVIMLTLAGDVLRCGAAPVSQHGRT